MREWERHTQNSVLTNDGICLTEYGSSTPSGGDELFGGRPGMKRAGLLAVTIAVCACFSPAVACYRNIGVYIDCCDNECKTQVPMCQSGYSSGATSCQPQGYQVRCYCSLCSTLVWYDYLSGTCSSADNETLASPISVLYPNPEGGYSDAPTVASSCVAAAAGAL